MTNSYEWQINFSTKTVELACEQLAFLTRGEKIFNPDKSIDIFITECIPYCNNDTNLQILMKKVIFKCYGLDY